MFAGLRDAYRLCANEKALTVAAGLADWFEKIHAGLSEEQIQEGIHRLAEAWVDLPGRIGAGNTR